MRGYGSFVPRLAPRSALLIAAFDSQLKWCAGIRDELEARGFSCRVAVPRTRSALSVRQISDAGFEDVHLQSWPELVEDSLRSDVVVCALAGPMTQRLSDRPVRVDRALAPRAPCSSSGWVGIIIEKITAGYLDRAGTDVVAVNSAHDLAYFRDTASTLGIPHDNLVLSGLPFLSSDPEPERGGEIQRVLFADQPTVPASPIERLHVYRCLVDYALEHPDREVLLKPRHRPGEDTFHRMAHHPADLLKRDALPANFRIDYTPIREQLPTVDLLLTMSSTACLEAIDHGCRVALVMDLGVHERYGNHVFLDSGLLRTFGEIKKDEIGTPDPAWVEGYFGDRTQPAKHTIVDRVEALLESRGPPVAPGLGHAVLSQRCRDAPREGRRRHVMDIAALGTTDAAPWPRARNRGAVRPSAAAADPDPRHPPGCAASAYGRPYFTVRPHAVSPSMSTSGGFSTGMVTKRRSCTVPSTCTLRLLDPTA